MVEELPELPELKLDIDDALERTKNVDTRLLFSSFPCLLWVASLGVREAMWTEWHRDLVGTFRARLELLRLLTRSVASMPGVRLGGVTQVRDRQRMITWWSDILVSSGPLPHHSPQHPAPSQGDNTTTRQINWNLLQNCHFQDLPRYANFFEHFLIRPYKSSQARRNHIITDISFLKSE